MIGFTNVAGGGVCPKQIPVRASPIGSRARIDKLDDLVNIVRFLLCMIGSVALETAGLIAAVAAVT
jgi:hypothetical protein